MRRNHKLEKLACKLAEKHMDQDKAMTRLFDININAGVKAAIAQYTKKSYDPKIHNNLRRNVILHTYASITMKRLKGPGNCKPCDKCDDYLQLTDNNEYICSCGNKGK